MTLLVAREIGHRFAGSPVLESASFRVSAGDRLCVFGRNGEGKSTLLNILAGRLKPDAGAVDVTKGATVGTLEQEAPQARAGSVRDVVTAGLGEISARTREYHEAVSRVATAPSEANLSALERAQTELESCGGWEAQERVATVLTRLGLSGDADFETLSGGWRRRAFLAASLVQQPDILLLDEPTNHLDVEAIEWLEDHLRRFPGAIVFVSHDRTFVRAVANRIVELDRGRLAEYPGDFDAYVERREHELAVEATHDAEFDKKLAREEVWIRTGIQARRTRNEGRVRALKRLREERARRRKRRGAARIEVQAAEHSGADVITANEVVFAYGDAVIVNGLSLTIKRGDRIGLIGPNGVGKSTLLGLLLGHLTPDEGTVEHGTRLAIGYSDQMREALDPSKTVVEVVCPEGDHVEINGRRRHVVGYLRDFLFEDAQARTPVSVLSGGERNRLLLARLFTQPANVLVLDEPTNDLDMETLAVLEERLVAFEGTVLVVSHDREFLDNVTTEVLVFHGEGEVERMVGGYADWAEVRAARREEAALAERARRERAAREAAPEVSSQPTPRRLDRRERNELEELPERIEAAEAEQAELHARLADPGLYRDAPDAVSAVQERLGEVERDLVAMYQRWEELEGIEA